MSGWYLEKISIEGFRGVNNEGAPLVLKFKSDAVNSIFAPNGVGKSSIYDALLYAITGKIPKLDLLPANEQGQGYYLNKFHSGNTGTIELSLCSVLNGNRAEIKVERASNGQRTVTAQNGVDGDAVLKEVDREFVLLDGETFREFINAQPKERGRSFASLLGLRKYSLIRQALTKFSNTVSFGNHFDLRVKTAKFSQYQTSARDASSGRARAYRELVGEDFDPALDEKVHVEKAYSALNGIELLKPACEGKGFEEVSTETCFELTKAAEGGEERTRYEALLRSCAALTEAIKKVPSSGSLTSLVELAIQRDAALSDTQGEVFRELYLSSQKILTDESWKDKTTCPTCERTGSESVLDHVSEKIASYSKVVELSGQVMKLGAESGFSQISDLEKLTAESVEENGSWSTNYREWISAGTINEVQAKAFAEYADEVKSRAAGKLKEQEEEKDVLEKGLPPKLTDVMQKIQAAKQLQESMSALRDAIQNAAKLEAELNRIQRVKQFLDGARDMFAGAEGAAATRRLNAIEPKMREFFGEVMHSEVVPALQRSGRAEDINISLEQFWNLPNVSARALLSESYRNAFAISVYLAAASLYGGDAKFVVLDDVTSSFDSGHQLHLMNVIKRLFARPAVPDGPQVILLSHDTALEKLFNTYNGEAGWYHQVIQGTARTSVLPQSSSVDKLRDATIDFLNSGNTFDGAPRVRQYLEFKLQHVIHKVNIPVPYDIVFSDDKKMAQNLITAIKNAVDIHQAANRLVLENSQVNGLDTALATIVGNFVSHWGTGQGQAFTAHSLLGVMRAIDAFADCFKYEDPAGSGSRKFYSSLSRR
ncbi:AAA family ATPase [Thalassospira aquimaris]|nr:AAA family ATPase [Thalassospira sp. FZY0004]MDG4721703.1 AAA family ATPase [Thalassospira sp. FZY0004]